MPHPEVKLMHLTTSFRRKNGRHTSPVSNTKPRGWNVLILTAVYSDTTDYCLQNTISCTDPKAPLNEMILQAIKQQVQT